MKLKKCKDYLASQIRWGIELETRIPTTAGVQVDNYHGGQAVRRSGGQAVRRSGGQAVRRSGGPRRHPRRHPRRDHPPLNAPSFQGSRWKPERDGSIRCDAGQMPCEFVYPILHGDEGVENLLRFVDFTHAIGATVNDSCGCHITVGIESVIGTVDPRAVSEFIRKLAQIIRRHARSLYGQTGAGRHLNHYSHPL